MSKTRHWEGIYRTKAPTEVSWYQPHAQLSIELIRRVALDLFPTDPADRARYLAQVRRVVRPGGHVIVASFGHRTPAGSTQSFVSCLCRVAGPVSRRPC